VLLSQIPFYASAYEAAKYVISFTDEVTIRVSTDLNIYVYIVTCQPIVGLRNSGCDPLLSDSSVNRFLRTHDDVIPGVGTCHMC
jgi:hypothetical protein